MKTQHGTDILPPMPGSLFDLPPIFDGSTYEAEHDESRLTGQMRAVYEYLRGHEWVTLQELSLATGGSEAGVSARLRDLRKARWGANTIERQRHEGGFFAYRLLSKNA